MATPKKPLDKFSSKVQRVNIHLPNYKYFHSPSLVDQNDDRFMGRKKIIDKLFNILTKNEPNAGAYLITGYRGMGKSSYVNKVLNRITLKKRTWLPNLLLFFGCYLLTFIFLEVFLHSSVNNRYTNFISLLIPILFVAFYLLINGCLQFHIVYDWFRALVNFERNFIKLKLSLDCKTPSILFIIVEIVINLVVIILMPMVLLFKLVPRLKYFILNIKELLAKLKYEIKENLFRKPRRVVLRLNLGHEILDEKDIISLLAKNIELEFKKFAYNPRRNYIFYTLKIVLILSLTIRISYWVPLQNKFKNAIFVERLFPSQSTEILSGSLDDQKFSYLYLVLESLDSKLNFDTTKIILENYSNFLNSSLPQQDRLFYRVVWITNLLDIYIAQGYYRLTGFISDAFYLNLNNKYRHLSYLFLIIFIFLNYSITVFFRLILKSNYIPYTSRKQINRKLRFLNESIDAIIKTSSSQEMGIVQQKTSIKFNLGKSKEFPMAGIRQIEKGLIDILDDMDNLAFPVFSPEFIIVFDELDKIDPRFNKNINDKEEELTDFDSATSGFSGGTATRLRKQNVLKLLANMKYFITTAKAKFIFISGRELYDAYLADVSDREFSISSIFHEVIYVESFLSDSSDNNKVETISMTEHYVCQLIIPRWFKFYQRLKRRQKYEILTLKIYEEYIKMKFRITDKDSIQDHELQIKKTIMLLYQFIFYLTHVSNGAPKKITNLFEQYIVSSNLCNSEADLFIVRNNAQTYLSFGYIEQCKIGFIHYLSNPIIMALVDNVNQYGDKLVISASFLINHIYKFHDVGFSWSSLEHAPEILDINRTPELRNFIGTIVGYLTQTHISPIVSGLYIFKFPKKISEEISLISKMSEEASAIFNFSLDESLSVKRHFSKLLSYYINQHTNEKQRALTNGEYVHSIAEIHHILGDLHLLDEEYAEAIFEYSRAVQYISLDFSNTYKRESKELFINQDITHILFIVRSILKTGLALERRKKVQDAYLTYCQLVTMAIDFRYFDEKQFGLKYKIQKENDWLKQKAVFIHSSSNLTLPDIYKDEMNPSEINEGDKIWSDFFITGDELIHNLARIITPLKNRLITRLSLFEDIGLMYQALLAKLFILEKIQLGGISLANLEVIEGEFLNLHLATNLKNKFLISADFYKKLGDILYYKNGLVNFESTNLFVSLDIWGYDINNNINKYDSVNAKRDLKFIEKIPFKYLRINNIKDGDSLKVAILNQYFPYGPCIRAISDEVNSIPDPAKLNISEFFSDKSFKIEGLTKDILIKEYKCIRRREYLLNKRQSLPCYACKYYNRSLRLLADNLLNQKNNEDASSKVFIFLSALDDHEKLFSNRSSFSQILASTLGALGDVLVSCSFNENYSYNQNSNIQYQIKDKISDKFLELFFNFISKKYSPGSSKERYNLFNREVQHLPLSHLEKAILYYLASAKYHKRASNLKEAHIMYKKILMLFLEYAKNVPNEKPTILKYIENIEKQIVKRIIQYIFSAYQHIHVVEVQKLKWVNTQQMYQLLELNQLSIFPEIEETLYVYYELNILCGKIIKMKSDNSDEISYEQLYKLQSLSPFRLNSSIYNRLISLRFKALLNMRIFEDIVKGYVFNNQVYKSDHPIQFYKSINDSLEDIIKDDRNSTFLNSFMYEICMPQQNDNKKGQQTAFFQSIEHLIIDSILCLQKFIEVVYPLNKSTLFTGSYIGDIYQQLFEWSLLFDFLFMLHAYNDDTYDSKDLYEKKYLINMSLSKSFERWTDSEGDSEASNEFKVIINKTLEREVENEIIKMIVKFSKQNKNKSIKKDNLSAAIEKIKSDSEKIIQYKFIAFQNDEFAIPQRTESYVVDFKIDIGERIDRIIPYLNNRKFSVPEKEIDAFISNEKYRKIDSILHNFSGKIYFQKKCQPLFAKLITVIDKSNTHLINPKYLAEMAIKNYQNAYAMNKEGKPYKNMIDDMYYLNDDLDNDTYKFHLALERYRINSGIISQNISHLKSVYSNSKMFFVGNYF